MTAHNWVKSTYGHGETMCTYCHMTNREAAVLGLLNECEHAPAPEPLPAPAPDDIAATITKIQELAARIGMTFRPDPEKIAAAKGALAPCTAPAPDAALADMPERVKEVVAECDVGFWRTCSGCYETVDGQAVGHYPYSEIFGCTLGGGCSECGGIGAIWDTTDYEDMGRALS